MKLAIPAKVVPLLARVSQVLAREGVSAYLVGGFVRDALLRRDTADMDIAVAADGFTVAAMVARELGGTPVPLDEINRVARVVLVSEGWQLDFSRLGGSIESDLARRDFTINALAVDLKELARGGSEAELLAPCQGWEDLRQGIIRAVSEGVFAADAARLLRGVRLAAELGFRMEPRTRELIRRDARLVAGVAGERLREELLRLLATSRNEVWHEMKELGLLTALFPELLPAQGTTQPTEHFWDVLRHSIEAVGAAGFLLRRGEWEYGGGELLAPVPWSEELAGYFGEEVSHGSTRRHLVKLAALLHDVAKPQTKAVDATGRTRFLGHAPEGAAIAVGVLERLRFSVKEIRLVETMIEHHLRPMQMTSDGLPTRRAIYRYFRDTGEAGIATLFLSLADHLATRGPRLDPAGWREHARLVAYVLKERFREEGVVAPPRLVDGHDLINIFGLAPGPKMGEILEKVREAQGAGELTTREEALAYVRRLMGQKPSSHPDKERGKARHPTLST